MSSGKHLAMRLREADQGPAIWTSPTVQALGGEYPAHWASSWYLCHPNGHRKTEAHPGRPGLPHWPRGFQAGHPPRSVSPAHSVQAGGLHWDRTLYFQNLQRNSAISQAMLPFRPFFPAEACLQRVSGVPSHSVLGVPDELGTPHAQVPFSS